jgi:hypothetical protein
MARLTDFHRQHRNMMGAAEADDNKIMKTWMTVGEVRVVRARWERQCDRERWGRANDDEIMVDDVEVWVAPAMACVCVWGGGLRLLE